jgi:tetratricopeptide (TPR) repeat protein
VAYLEDHQHIATKLGQSDGIAFSQTQITWVQLQLGQGSQLWSVCERALFHSQETGDSLTEALAYTTLGQVAMAEDSLFEAEKLLQAGLDITRQLGSNGLIIGQILSYAGYVARKLSKPTQAKACFVEALQVALVSRTPLVLLDGLLGIALLLTDFGQVILAVELTALARCYPYIADSHWFEAIAGHELDLLTATLPLEIVQTAQARGRSRDLWQTAAALLIELDTSAEPQSLPGAAC